jgi:hypothetical protein
MSYCFADHFIGGTIFGHSSYLTSPRRGRGCPKRDSAREMEGGKQSLPFPPEPTWNFLLLRSR